MTNWTWSGLVCGEVVIKKLTVLVPRALAEMVVCWNPLPGLMFELRKSANAWPLLSVVAVTVGPFPPPNWPASDPGPLVMLKVTCAPGTGIPFTSLTRTIRDELPIRPVR